MGNTTKVMTGFLGLGDFSDDCDSLPKCNSLIRIKTVLEVYQTVHNDQEYEMQQSIMQYIEANDYHDLVNDYHHLLTKHLNYASNNINKIIFNKINNEICSDIKCNINECNTYRRNQRNKEKQRGREEKEYRNYDFKGIFITNLLDNIHTYFIHGYESGFRIKFDNYNTYNNINNDNIFSHDPEIVSLESALWLKRTNLIKLRGEKTLINNKYQTFSAQFNTDKQTITSSDDYTLLDILCYTLTAADNIFNNVLSKNECLNLYLWLQENAYDSDALMDDVTYMAQDKCQSNIYQYLTGTKIAFLSHKLIKFVRFYKKNTAEEQDDDLKQKQKEFKNTHGQRFFYWEVFKNNNDDIVFNPGYKYKDWYIARKYATLKTEILHFLSINEYNITKNKAIRLLHASMYLKTMQSAMECDAIPLPIRRPRPYGVQPGEPLSYFHLLSVLFYTDYPHLSSRLCSTFQRRPHETDYELKQRNSEFHNWSKLLHETVHLYGTNLYGIRYDYKSKQWTSQDVYPPTLYHSVASECLNSFICRFCAPTSMTRQIEVAVIYSDNGVIMEIENYKHIDCSPYFFNCWLVSGYTVEDEHLFIGGSSVSSMCKGVFDYRLLQCLSIRSIEIKQNILWHLRALSVLDNIISSDLCYTGNFEKIYIKRERWYFKVVNGLLMEVQHESVREYHNYPQFIINYFKQFIQNTKRIKICVHCLKQFYPSFTQLFQLSSKQKCSNLLLVDNICAVFKQCKRIEFYPEVLTREFVNEFIAILNNIDETEHKWRKLKSIKLLNYRYSKELNVSVSSLFIQHDEYWDWIIEEEKDSWDHDINQMRYTLTAFRV